jgi:hypothetical protein
MIRLPLAAPMVTLGPGLMTDLSPESLLNQMAVGLMMTPR